MSKGLHVSFEIDEEIINGEHEDDIEVKALMRQGDYFNTESTGGERAYNKTGVKMTTETYLITDNYLATESGEALVEDCKSIIVEKTFESHWALLEGYHALGERIINDKGFQQYAKGNTTCLQCLAKNLSISERTLYYSMQFYQKYPDMNVLPNGKACTWSKIVKLLPQGEHPHKKSLKDVLIAIKELLKHDWEDNNALYISEGDPEASTKCEYIRYLQDQIAKLEG